MAQNRNNEAGSSKASRKKLTIRIMAWVLSILMIGSMATLTITLIVNMAASAAEKKKQENETVTEKAALPQYDLLYTMADM